MPPSNHNTVPQNSWARASIFFSSSDNRWFDCRIPYSICGEKQRPLEMSSKLEDKKVRMNVTCHSETGSSAAERDDPAATGGAQASGDAAVVVRPTEYIFS
jgi:hypothetical protein